MEIDFDLDFDDTAARRVSRYVRQVMAGLGLRGNSSYVESEPYPSAYVALAGRLADHPDNDVALVWDEKRGWAAAVEDASGQLTVVARLGGEVKPPAADVAAWAQTLLRNDLVPAPRSA